MDIDTDKMIRVIRDHKQILLESSNTSYLDLTDQQVENFKNNFFGLIRDLRLPRVFSQCYLIMNDLDEATQTFTKTYFVAPSETDMLELYKKS